MNISILSVFPELYTSFLQTSLVRRAQEAGHITVDTADFFSYVQPKERIDASTFGHGAGMLLKPDVVQKAIEDKEQTHGPAYKIFFSPQGKKLTQRGLRQLYKRVADKKHLMLVASRYEGMDARVEEHYADEVVSIGDYVLMGGDLPAMVLLEGMLRLMPGVVGKQESVQEESFSGSFVDYPAFAPPVVWQGKEVPEVIRSGNHAAIAEWRREQAARKTVRIHFDWLRTSALNEKDVALAKKYIPPHYAALMHTQVMIKDGDREGTTSVTSLDIHDIARSAATYGLSGYFVVTPLRDQRRIVQTLLDFWQNGPGSSYNTDRQRAVKQVELVDDLDAAIAAITTKEGKAPLVIATSAQQVNAVPTISYFDQERAWATGRPVLLLFGTGNGLSESALKRCDFVLAPLEGFSDFNHLSVRSAAAIVFDRWLGRNLARDVVTELAES